MGAAPVPSTPGSVASGGCCTLQGHQRGHRGSPERPFPAALARCCCCPSSWVPLASGPAACAAKVLLKGVTKCLRGTAATPGPAGADATAGATGQAVSQPRCVLSSLHRSGASSEAPRPQPALTGMWNQQPPAPSEPPWGGRGRETKSFI